MPGEYPSDYLDEDGLPRGLSSREWNDDGTPKKAAKKTAKKAAKKD